MENARETIFILTSTPFYIIIIVIEILYSHLHKRGLYSTKGTLSNILLTSLNMGLDILIRFLYCSFILNFFYEKRFVDMEANPLLYWTVLFITEDFMYYWLHRIDHFCRLFWAVHVTHHNSEEYNLTVGFRSSVFQPIYRFAYFIPVSLLGFKEMDIMFMYSATQIFGILCHTQTVGKLGILEYFLVTPSHHRVHHASNIKYLDKNMGMVLIIWDKLFGTFQKEEQSEPVKFGLTKNINTYNPITTIFHEWINIFDDLRKNCSFKDKLLYIFGPPGWSHDGSRKTSAQLRAELEK